MAPSANSYQFSGKLFYRIYFTLVIIIILIGSILDSTVTHNDSDDYINHIKQTHSSLLILISNQLQKKPETQWQQEAITIGQSTHQNVYLLQLSDFNADAETLKRLKKGEILALFDNDDAITLYKRAGLTSTIIGIDVIAWKLANDNKWLTTAFYLLIAIAVFLLIQPFSKQLFQIRQAAIKFGKGQFSTRLLNKPKSTLEPISTAFNSMANKIESLMLSQRDLTNAVSHELRTPIARLKFSFEEIESCTKNNSVINNIETMREDVKELEILIDEMIQYSKLSQVKDLIASPINVHDLIIELLANNSSPHIKILSNMEQIKVQQQIYGDKHSLLRALSNILRNCISYASSLCEVSVCYEKELINIVLCDDGPGLLESDFQRVFEPFYSVKSNGRVGGYGLGLSIAKKIINNHGGTIEVFNKQGACFKIVLPTS